MRILRYIIGIILAAAYFICSRTWLAHIIYYNGEHSTFLYGNSFRDSFIAAEGTAAYINSWIGAMMAHPFVGPLLLAILCASVYYLADALIRAIFRRPDLLALSMGASILTFASASTVDSKLTAVWAVPVVLAVVLIIVSVDNRLCHRSPVKPFAFLRGKSDWIFTVAVIGWGVWGYLHILHGINLSERAMLLTERAAREKRYDEVISRADTYLSQGHVNMLMSLFRNLALAEKGDLPDHLLDYPMPFGAEGLSFAWNSDSRQSEYGAPVYEAVGHINEAHRWESEALVVWGATPRRLAALARYNIAMGRPEAARKFIKLLERAPFRKDEAKELMRAADAGEYPGLRNPLRDEGQTPARWANVTDITPELEAICAADSTATVARQYLLCELLLRNNVSRFTELLPLYGPEGELPRIYQEALMLAALKPGVEPPMIDRVSSQVKAAFNRYLSLTGSGNSVALKNEFGNSYWFYLNHISPYGKTAR